MKAAADILIVEDEGLVALDMQASLERLGYRVVAIADTAADAVRLTREQRPALVLMDIRIQGAVDGIDAAREIGVRFGAPVIFVTGNADEATLGRATAAEPFGYIVKPIDQRELKAVIETALQRHRAESRLRNLERWLVTVLRSISDAVAIIDREGRVSFLNGAAETLTGWSMGEALGRSHLEVLRRADLGPGAQAAMLQDVLRGLNVAAAGPGAVLLRRDGSPIAVRGSLSPVVDETEVTGAVLVLRSAPDVGPPPAA